MPEKIKDKIRVNLRSPCQKDRVPQLLRADGVNKLIRSVPLKNRKLLSLKRKKYQQAETFESNLSRVNYQKIFPLKPLQTRVKEGNSQLNKIGLV
jgi:hypothetical protein